MASPANSYETPAMTDRTGAVIRLIPMVNYHRFINGQRWLKSPAPDTYLVGATTWPSVGGRMATLKAAAATNPPQG